MIGLRKNWWLDMSARVVFLVAMMLGVVRLFDAGTRPSGVVIAVCGFFGVALSFLNTAVRKIWGKELPFTIMLFVDVFVFLAVLPGEILGFYYGLWWWDIFLHVLSGFGITYVVWEIFWSVLQNNKVRWKVGFIAVITLMSSLGCAVVWEVMEFSVDTAFGTNMQKFIPTEFLSHDVGAVYDLVATDEEIAKYYREPAGYKYALKDTMDDHLSYLAGAVGFVAGFGARKKRKVADV